MVQDVTIPLSWGNNIPGVSGIRDVEFRVPTLDDIDQAIRDAVLDPSDIQTAVEEGIGPAIEDALPVDELADLIVDPIVEELETALGVDLPSVEELVGEFIDQADLDNLGPIEVDIQGSLFDIEQDLVDLLADALEEAGLQVPEVPDLLGEAQAALEAFLPVPQEEVADAIETAVTALTAFSDEVTAFIDDPTGTTIGWAQTLTDAAVDQGFLISEEARQELEEALDD